MPSKSTEQLCLLTADWKKQISRQLKTELGNNKSCPPRNGLPAEVVSAPSLGVLTPSVGDHALGMAGEPVEGASPEQRVDLDVPHGAASVKKE